MSSSSPRHQHLIIIHPTSLLLLLVAEKFMVSNLSPHNALTVHLYPQSAPSEFYPYVYALNSLCEKCRWLKWCFALPCLKGCPPEVRHLIFNGAT
jgi:hypothetical protein